MSQSNTNTPTGMTQDQVRAATPQPTEAQVSAALAAAAPTDPVEQQLAAFAAKVDAIEATLARYAPMLSMIEGLVGTFIPGSKPIIATIQELQGVVTDLVSSLDTHFQGKIALPAPPAPMPSAPPV